MMRNEVVAIILLARVSKQGYFALRSFTARPTYPSSQGDHAGRTDIPERVFAVAGFHVDVLQRGRTVPSPGRSGSDAKLVVALHNAVRDPECVTGLPIDPVPAAVHAQIHVFQPAHRRVGVEGPRRINSCPAEFRVTAYPVTKVGFETI